MGCEDGCIYNDQNIKMGSPLQFWALPDKTPGVRDIKPLSLGSLSLKNSVKRQLITAVKLEIGWADQLWAKFPLVARALGELKCLVKLEIVIIEKGGMVEDDQEALIEKDASLDITITYGQRPPATDRASHRMKREGSVADAMLKAEMKMLKDLVGGFKGLKHFKLRGFRHEVFAWCLEEHVRMGNH